MCQKLKIVQHLFAPFGRCHEHFDGFGVRKQKKVAYFVSGGKKIGTFCQITIEFLQAKSYALVDPF